MPFEVKRKFDQHASYIACALTCAYNGIVYAFPMLTTKLQGAGLSSSNVVIAGVMLQLGYGLISYPFAKFYTRRFFNLGLAATDRLISIVSAIIVCIGLAMLLGAASVSASTNEPISMALVCIGCLCWSSGMGISFYQGMTIANITFAKNKALRRKAVAFLSFSIGIGSCFFVALFYYAMTPLTLLDNVVVIWAIYAGCAVFRIIFMVRKEVPQAIPASQAVKDSEPVHGSVPKVGLSDKKDPENTNISDTEARAGSSIAPEVIVPQEIPPEERRATRKDYFTSPIVWLLSVSAVLAYGIGSIFLNSLGNLAGYFVDDEDMMDKLTFQLSMTFLAMIILARFLTTLIYSYVNWPHVSTLWNCTVLAGMVIYVAFQSLAGAFLAAALIGFGFGGIVSCMAVVSSVSFPGGVADGSMNLAIAFSVTSPGPILLGLIGTAIYNASSLNEAGVVEIKSVSTYIYYLCVLSFGTFCAVLLGCYLNRALKLETAILENEKVLKDTQADNLSEKATQGDEQVIHVAQSYDAEPSMQDDSSQDKSALQQV